MLIDAQEREQARTAKVNILVEAGAGTGKTTLLVDRVLHAILAQNIPLSRMLLVTFMDKAQEEMRSRVELQLKARLQNAEGDSARRLQMALRMLPHADVTTIHGFCHRVLTEWGADWGVPFDFRVIDDIEASRLWEESYRDWMETLDEASLERVRLLLKGGVGWDDLRVWARNITDWTELPTIHYTWPHVMEFVENFESQALQYQALADISASASDAGRQQIADIVREFKNLHRVDPADWPRMLAMWRVSLAPKGNQKNWQAKGQLKAQKLWVQELKGSLEAIRIEQAQAYLGQWVELIWQSFRPFWRKRRFSAQLLTYNDLLVEAERVTRQSEVRRELSKRYDLVMVDEFQDTDPLQAAIIRRLVSPTDQLSVHDQGRLFLVGDPKQSIYRFRGADVETYQGVREELTGSGGQVLPIVQNFRCHPDILDFVNERFEHLWPREPDSSRPYVPVFRPLFSNFPRDRLKRVHVESLGLGQSADVKRIEEAQAISEVIERAVAEGWPVRQASGDRAPITYRDIALIIPQRTGIDFYRQAMKDRGIPVASQSGRKFFEQDEIRGLSHLFRCLHNPDDEVATVGWLLSPWVSLTHQELAQHRQLGGTFDYRQSTTGLPKVVFWWEKLAHWHRQFWRVDPQTVWDWATSESSLLAVLKERGDSAALANLFQMRDLCRDLGTHWTIFAFSDWLHRQVVDRVPFDEAEITTVDDEVTISTVHQAKGLEWPFVIVANWKPHSLGLGVGVHYNPRLKKAALRQGPWVSRDFPELDTDHSAREAAEAERLLYVALTRPRDYLWFYDSFADG